MISTSNFCQLSDSGASKRAVSRRGGSVSRGGGGRESGVGDIGGGERFEGLGAEGL